MTEYYKVVKFKTGENILCSMQQDLRSSAGESFITVKTPVQLIPSQETRQRSHRGKVHEVIGESFVLRPWMGLSNNEDFMMNTDMILTIGDLKSSIKEFYIDYVNRAQLAQQLENDSDAAIELIHESGNSAIIDENYIREIYDDDDDSEEGPR